MKDQLYLVKTNREYDALNNEMDHLKTLLSESEENLLMGETEIEKGQEAKKINILEIDNLTETLQADKNNLKGALENSQSKLKVLNKNKNHIVDEMNNIFLSQY